MTFLMHQALLSLVWLTAPWWLLLESPEDWDDLDQVLLRFKPRLRTFLEFLSDCEAEKIQDGSLSESQRLSTAMEKSLETGLFGFVSLHVTAPCSMGFIGVSLIQDFMVHSQR